MTDKPEQGVGIQITGQGETAIIISAGTAPPTITSKVFGFVGDLVADGFRFVGILAPLMSIGFTLFKMFGPTGYNVHDVSYA